MAKSFKDLNKNTASERDEMLDNKRKIEEERRKPPDESKEKEEKEEEGISIDFPANVVIVGERYQGKSSMVLSILSMYDFDYVFTISLTPESKTFDEVSTFVRKDISEQFIQEIIEEHSENPELKTCFLFDDFIGMTGFNPKTSPGLSQIASSGRHKGISLIFSSQDWVAVPLGVRRQAEYIFLGGNKEEENEKSCKFLAMGDMTKKKLSLLVNRISSDNMKQFILLDRKKKKWHQVEAFILA